MTKCGKKLLGLLTTLAIFHHIQAQFTVLGELRTRSEFRDGTGTLRLKQNSAAFFTSQRSRLTVDYKLSHTTFHATVQDVSVWGQDASTISNADGSKFSVHEAWAEIAFTDSKDSSFKHTPVDYFGVKIGRQELIYDDQRLMGNLDWLQQARRHDALVLKLRQKRWQVDLGAAFNQNTDAFNYNGTFYTPANVTPFVKDSKGNLASTPPAFIPLKNKDGISTANGTPAVQVAGSTNGLYQDYKALTFLHAARKFNNTTLSALMVVDYFSKYLNDSVSNIAGRDTGYVYGRRFNQHGVNARLTGGVQLNSFLDEDRALNLTAGFYYQFGKDRDGQQLNAYTSTLSLQFFRNCFTYSIGWDFLSGDNSFSSSKSNHRFDPLYGTPHKFWGLMDYFYVGTGSPAGGLNNPFAKVRYAGNSKKFTAELACHYFGLAENQKDTLGAAIKKYLGSEADFTTSYSLNNITTVEYGFSVLAASGSMEYAKNIIPGTSRLTGVWTYLMVTIKPDFLIK